MVNNIHLNKLSGLITNKIKMDVNIKFKVPTWLKTKPVQAAELSTTDKTLFSEKILQVTSALSVARQHTLLSLKNPLLAADKQTYLEKVYVYTPHIEYNSALDGGKVKKLNVPYFSQLDNSSHLFGPGSRQCNLTACAMFLAGLKPSLVTESKKKGFDEFESYYGNTLDKYGDTTDHGANTKALSEFGVTSYFSYTLSIKDLLDCLRSGYPVVMGVAYKSSGHMVVATGYDLDKEYIFIHDPYGIRYGYSDSYDVGAYAAYDPWSFETLEQVWVDMGNEAGWGRIPTKIDGVSTGLKDNL